MTTLNQLRLLSGYLARLNQRGHEALADARRLREASRSQLSILQNVCESLGPLRRIEPVHPERARRTVASDIDDAWREGIGPRITDCMDDPESEFGGP